MADQGAIERIDKLQDVPLRMAEAILEGLSKNTGDTLVLGMGFIAGYMGFDIMAYLMRPFKEIAAGMKSAAFSIPLKAVDMAMPMADVPIEVGAGLGSGMLDLIGMGFPGKRITPAAKGQVTAAGASYYGPPPAGYSGEWPPYGITLAQIKGEIEKAQEGDKAKWEFELYVAEVELKICMGCMAAIAAYTVTRPGFIPGVLQGVGSIAQGIGEAVPL